MRRPVESGRRVVWKCVGPIIKRDLIYVRFTIEADIHELQWNARYGMSALLLKADIERFRTSRLIRSPRWREALEPDREFAVLSGLLGIALQLDFDRHRLFALLTIDLQSSAERSIRPPHSEHGMTSLRTMRSIGSGLSSLQSGHGTLMMVAATSGFMAASSFDQVTREIAIARSVEWYRQIGSETYTEKRLSFLKY